jgi:hypothetical protein
VSTKRDPDERPHLDEEPDRGDVSKEGFSDYDKEAHPKRVDIDEPEPATDDRERVMAGQPELKRAAAPNRFEVHFRMMKLRI